MTSVDLFEDYPSSQASDYELYMFQQLLQHFENSKREDVDNVRQNSDVYMASTLEVFLLGITIVIGGQYFGWNAALESGFGSTFLLNIFVGMAYICLIFSNSEIVSAAPFAGGAYGISRCTLGNYIGFLIGMSEALEYIFYVATSALQFSRTFVKIMGVNESYEPIIWISFYVISIIIHCNGGRLFWYSSNILAVISCLVIVIYCFGSVNYVDFPEYATHEPTLNSSDNDTYFVGGAGTAFRVLPLLTWFYVGIESLPFVAKETINPTQTVGVASICCVLTLFVSSIGVLIFCCSSAPGVYQLQDSLSPLAYNFSRIFNCSRSTADVILLPGLFATAFGFIFAYGRLIHALACSRLLPVCLTQVNMKTDAPQTAILAGSLVSLCVCILVYCFPLLERYLFNLCILAGFLTYCSQCIGYIAFQTVYRDVRRQYRSPFGIFGAIYAAIVFTCGIISVVFLQRDHRIAFATYFVISFLVSIYYFTVVEQRQQLSVEEERVLLSLHVINYKARFQPMRRSYTLLSSHENPQTVSNPLREIESLASSLKIG